MAARRSDSLGCAQYAPLLRAYAPHAQYGKSEWVSRTHANMTRATCPCLHGAAHEQVI
jgi:hypothetical protein